MQRYNIFNQVHKGLRALMFETSLLLQRADFTRAEEADHALERMHEVIVLFEKHAFSEDTFVFYAIRPYEPSIVHEFEKEHEKDKALSQRLSGLCTVFAYSLTDKEKREAGESINKAFLKFMVFNLEHMAKEETVINKALWRYFTDEEISGIEHKILSSISDNAIAIYSKWMMRGLNNDEIISWLKKVERRAPEYVFQSLFTTAEKELPDNRFREVLEGLAEGAMLN